MVSRNRKIARRIGQAVANDVLDISGAISAGAGVTVYATADDLPTTGLTAGDEAFVSGSNRLYISNGTGWYSIGLVNTNPAITSVEDPSNNTTPFTLATDGSALVLTITAADPEDIPLTYNYAVTTGSLTNGGGTTATVVQGTGASTNQFTITPTTTEAYGGTFELTFTTSDGINQASSVNSFTLEFITTITNSRYTTLLATAVDTSDNNNITDASSNNHSITVNGDAHAGTFSPYRSGGYSTYFDGAGDYLNAPGNAAFEFGTGDFSIELFFYRTASGSVDTLLQYGNASVTGYSQISWTVYISSSNYLSFEISDGTPGGAGKLSLVSSVLFPTNSWVHVSVVRDGNNFTLYQNGNSVSTTTDSRSVYVSPAPLLWIARNHSTGSGDTAGFFSNVRIVKGTAVYTTNFTPPTESLTAITNTELLTCHLPYIADGSTNDHSITINGNPSTKPFSPYDYTEYDAADHGGSVYFDRASYNSGACITVADHNDFTLGTSDWTVKFWVYHNEIITSANNAYGYFSNYYFNTPGGFGLKWMNQHGNKPVLEYMNSGSYAKKIFDFIPSEKIWYYYELTCSSSTVTFKVNGDTIGTQSMPDLGNPNRTLIVGAASNGSSGVENFLGGYIADFQYVIGGTASESSVPTALMSTDSNSTLHIKGTDASIIDKSQGTNLKLVGNTTGSTTQAKFGGSKSMYFDGTGDYALISKDTANINTLDKDFTIEYWLYDSSPTTWKYVVVKADNTGNTSASELSFGTGQFTAQTDGKLYFSNTLGAYLAYTNSALSANTWYHIAVVRNNNVFTMYLDGVAQTATTTNTGSVTAVNEDLVLGGHQYQVSSLGRLNGYIQDFRFTKGLARYTANFTPPTAELEG